MKKTKEGNSLIDQKSLILKELVEGIKLGKQLRIQMLNSANNNINNNTCLRDEQTLINYSLVDKILCSFNKSISLAKLFDFDNGVRYGGDDHSKSRECSLGSEISSQDLRVSKKRKKMSSRVEMVQVNPNKTFSGLEGPLNDGLTWRKYGQKDIFGAKFPRSYYRCSNRYTQSCMATKQLQKSDEDPSIYQVIYNGEHTCLPGAHLAQPHKKPKSAQINTSQSNQQEISLGRGPKREIKPIDKENEAQMFRSFSFNSTHIEPILVDEFTFGSSFPEFRLTETSDSRCLPDLGTQVTIFGNGINVQTSESYLNEPNSGASSTTDSPISNVDDFVFDFDMLPDLDSNFSFDFDLLASRI